MSDVPLDAVPAVARVPEALGQSEAFLAFQARLSRVARVDRPVLLIGERGTGKELAARRLHYLSPRWERPLVALNCAALTPTLIESELFGYEAGAFTGAVGRRAGRFETADGGTLFLDEIASIPLEVQEKILRVVEYGTFERVGSAESIEVDVRIVGATNADLAALATEGEFKQDLLDRLSFEVLFVPPLREREGDVMGLAEHFAVRMAHELGWSEVPEFEEDAAARLVDYSWPGNIRELKNVVDRAVYRSEGPLIGTIDFSPFSNPYPPSAEPRQPAEPTGPEQPVAQRPAPAAALPELPFEQAVRELQVGLLRRALRRARYNQRQAAEDLGLTYHQFRGLYRKFQDELA
jgi:psp operon transcriptional activator